MNLDQYSHREPIADRGISVVMPAYNEADCLETSIAGVSEVLNGMSRGHEIIVVDDGSADATAEIAQRIADANRRVRLVRHAAHQGYGAALRSGFEAAKYPLVLQLDSDNQYDASDIERLLAHIDQADVICGRREVRQSRRRGRLADWFYRCLLRFVFAVRVRDVDCGFKLFRRVALRRIPIQSSGWFADAEVLAKATFMNLLVGEAAVTQRPRSCGAEQRPREPFRHTLREAARVFWRPQFTPVSANSRRDAAPQAA